MVVSYYDFHLDQGIEPRKVSPALRLLDCLGLIDIAAGTGARRRSRYQRSTRNIGKTELATLPKDAIVINVGRGQVLFRKPPLSPTSHRRGVR